MIRFSICLKNPSKDTFSVKLDLECLDRVCVATDRRTGGRVVASDDHFLCKVLADIYFDCCGPQPDSHHGSLRFNATFYYSPIICKRNSFTSRYQTSSICS